MDHSVREIFSQTVLCAMISMKYSKRTVNYWLGSKNDFWITFFCVKTPAEIKIMIEGINACAK